ncbi:MAG: hypothetical protein AAGJ31_02445, partial [Verrucomicrobiota bacterium]
MQNITTLRRALEKSPKSLRLWLLYGQKCLTAKELREARTAFERAAEISNGDPEALLGIAQVLFHGGKISESCIRAEAIAKLHFSFAPVHLLLSQIYLRENDRDKAAEHYGNAKMLCKSLGNSDLERELARPVDRRPLTSTEEPPLIPWDQDDHELLSGEEYLDLGSDFIEPEEEVFNFEEFERPQGKFEDVAGLEEVKE